MVEQLRLEQLLTEEARLGGRIVSLQQAIDSLDTGPENLSLRDLSQARKTVRGFRAKKYIARVQRRLTPITDQIDEQCLALAQDHLSQSRKMTLDLGVVERSGIPPFSMSDIMRFRQEIVNFEGRVTENPLLARGIRVYNRQNEGIVPPQAIEPVGKIDLTYADIEQRGPRLSPTKRRLMEGLLPYASTDDPDQVQSTISGPDWSALVWPDIPWGERKGRLKTLVSRMREEISGTGFSIPLVGPIGGAQHIPGSYYLKVDPRLVSSVEEDNFLKEKISPIKNYRNLGLPAKVWQGMESSRLETKQFIVDFLGSEDAYSFLNCMYRYCRTRDKLSREERDLFFQLASGSLNEWLAFRHLYPRYLAEGLTMFSPHQKFTLYRNAHPEKDVEEDQFGINREIKGVPSPDSLLINPVPKDTPKVLRIDAIVECKNVTGESPEIAEYIDRQHARYTPKDTAFNLRLNNPKYPGMPSRLARLVRELVDPSLPAELPLTVNPEMEVIYAVPIDAPRLPIRDIKPPEFIPVTSGEIAGVTRILAGILN